MSSSDRIVLGVNIAASVAYLGLVVPPLLASANVTAKIAPPANVDGWEGIRLFADRLVTEVRSKKVAVVVFVEPRKYNNWSYTDCHRRVSLETAAGLSVRAAGVDVQVVAQRTVAAGLGYRTLSSMDESLPGRIALGPIVHWADRAIAFAAALHVASQVGPE